jgi:uncharacterized protein
LILSQLRVAAESESANYLLPATTVPGSPLSRLVTADARWSKFRYVEGYLLMTDIDLKRHLEPLGERHRVAYAACCCERVLPAYEAFSAEDSWGDPRPLREALDRVWTAVVGERLGQTEADELAKRCEPQIHHLDDPFSSIFTSAAQNAAIAMLTAVECAVDGDLELAEQVGEQALESFETYVDATEGEGSVFDAGLIESSRLFQDEIFHQREDLETLAEHPELNDGLIQQLRTRSQARGFAAIVTSLPEV